MNMVLYIIIILFQVDKNINYNFIFYEKIKNFLRLKLLIKFNNYIHKANKISHYFIYVLETKEKFVERIKFYYRNIIISFISFLFKNIKV